MDRAANNVLYALWLEKEVKQILEADASNTSWDLIDKSKLPYQCFLWVEDRVKKNTWHLPYREGAGGIDPETKMYRHAGPVNLNALRAIAQAMGGARTGSPMNVPKEIKSKITKLLKEYGIGSYKESRKDETMSKIMQICETTLSGQFVESVLDKETRKIPGVVLLRETSGNRYFPGSTGTKFSEAFRQAVADNINGKKLYKNHESDSEMQKRNGVRDVDDILGYYENGRLDAGIPKADIIYLSAHAPMIESLVGEMADKVGLSIVANGEMSYDKDTGIAEAFNLKELYSADLVTEPGSTVNMFESNQTEEVNDMDYKELSMKSLQENRPDLIEGLKKDILSEASAGQETEALKTKIAELEESGKELKKKVDENEVKEALAEKAERINVLLEESKIDTALVTDVFRATLSDAKDDEAIKALIEDRKTLKVEKEGVKGMGDHKKVEESKLSDEDYKKAMKTATGNRG